jgi:hypothetical protein
MSVVNDRTDRDSSPRPGCGGRIIRRSPLSAEHMTLDLGLAYHLRLSVHTEALKRDPQGQTRGTGVLLAGRDSQFHRRPETIAASRGTFCIARSAGAGYDTPGTSASAYWKQSRTVLGSEVKLRATGSNAIRDSRVTPACRRNGWCRRRPRESGATQTGWVRLRRVRPVCSLLLGVERREQ